MASVLAVHSLPISAVYSGTKAYVLAFTRGLQAELAETGVKVQLVLPASTATEIWSEEVSGIPLSALRKESIMSAEDMVDASLTGLDNGETITWPSVADEACGRRTTQRAPRCLRRRRPAPLPRGTSRRNAC